MAPMEALSYLPPLDGCLERENQILSWRLAWSALQTGGNEAQTSLTRFFEDPRTITALIHSLDPMPWRRADARAEFDTYTSAINISPNGNTSHDLKMINEDALWLSKELKIDEITALRVTVLEWESRSITSLRNRASHDASFGLSASSRLRSSLLRSTYQPTTSKHEDSKKFNSQPARRLRILRVWCIEQQFQLKCLEQIVVNTLENPNVESDNSRHGKNSSSADKLAPWASLGSKITKSWDSLGQNPGTQRWMRQMVDFIGVTAQQLANGSGLLQDTTDFDEFQMLWCETKGVELTCGLHVVMIRLQYKDALAQADEFGAWFHLMGEVNFFEGFEIPLIDSDSLLRPFLSSLSVLASLAVLNVPNALDDIARIAQLPASVEASGEVYLQDGQVMEEATRIILTTLQYGCRASQPVALAWSIILQEGRERTQHSQESRDSRLQQRAYDSIGQQLSDTESNDSIPRATRSSSNRRTSFGSDTSQQTTLLEHNLEYVQKVEPHEDVIHLIAHSSLSGPGAFDYLTSLALGFCPSFGVHRVDQAESRMRYLMLQVIEAALSHVQYGVDIVATALALLNGGQERWERRSPKHQNVSMDLGVKFLQSSALLEQIFGVASSRFPFESVPFLELCSALASSRLPNSAEPFIITFLTELETYTTVVSEEEARYKLLDDDPYYIKLQTKLDVSASYGSLGRSQQLALPSNVPFQASIPNLVLTTLPEGTEGLTLSDTKPMVVQFNFKQSGFAYLGRMVQQAATTYSSPEKRSLPLILQPAVKIIELLTKLLQAASSDFPSQTMTGSAILEAFSEGLDRNADIVSVILDIFEGELYEQHSLGGSVTEVLSHCVRFVRALLPIQPARAWPFLGRSSLLGVDGVESRFLGIVASQEMPVGRYPFLIECLYLFETMIDDVVLRSAAKHFVSSALTRFEVPIQPSGSAGIKDSQVGKILHVCTKNMVDIFESSGQWKSSVSEEKFVIHDTLCRTMDRLLRYCYDTDDTTQLSAKLTGVLALSADYLLDVFLSRSKNEIPIESFIQNLYESLQIPSNPLMERTSLLIRAQTISTIVFADTLIRINTYLERPSCRLEESLFSCAEVLSRVFASHDSFRQPIIELMLSMTTGSSRTLEQPPSLLGYLGQQPAKWFLDVLAMLDGPVPDTSYVVTIWKFLSAVVSQRQQWFAIYLLTGKTARSSLQERDNGKTTESHVRSLLDIATSKLCRIDLLDHAEAVGMLEFVALAADFWLWVPQRLETNVFFLKELVRILKKLSDRSHNPHAKRGDEEPLDVQMAASIANIFAMIVHRGSEVKDTTFARSICIHLGYFVKDGVSITSYNLSLHRSLEKNFEAKYPKCKISNFKRTAVHTAPLGRNFFYDLGFADKVLGFNQAWAREDGKGFMHEVERANLNLSLVQAQINLFHAWKSLAVEMALALGTEKVVQGYISKVVYACLESNRETIIPDRIFGKLSQSRADLAFVLLQRMTEVSRSGKEAKSILLPAWSTLRGHAPDLGLALSSSDANYDRTLLKIVYLALQSYLPGPSEAATEGNAGKGILSGPKLYAVILDILDNCVARGYRSVVSVLHEDPKRVVPTDLALLNAILRTCLHIPNIDRQTEQLVGRFTDNQTARYASTLFSWADQLMVNGNPIYGELSIEFLVELSNVPALAESIVLGGVLGQISASSLTKFLTRPGGSGPFDQPGLVHVIWARGILPLVINLLTAIGAPIAGDVATFLDQFRPQLERASQSLDPKPSHSNAGHREGCVTLSIASEVHSLAIISSILDLFQKAGPSAGIAPNEVPRLQLEIGLLRNDLETRLQRRNALREDIIALDPREEAWARQKATDSATSSNNLLEQKIVEELKGAYAVLGEQD